MLAPSFFVFAEYGRCHAVKSAVSAEIERRCALGDENCDDLSQPFSYRIRLRDIGVSAKGYCHSDYLHK